MDNYQLSIINYQFIDARPLTNKKLVSRAIAKKE